MSLKEDLKPDLEDRYEVTEEDKAFGPPNAERRGVSRILTNSLIVAVVVMAGIGLYMLG